MTILKLTEVELDRILIIKQIQERMLTQEQASNLSSHIEHPKVDYAKLCIIHLGRAVTFFLNQL